MSDSARTTDAPAGRADTSTTSTPADSELAQPVAALASVPNVAPAGDVDQRLLRQFPDHCEDLRQIAHAWMKNHYARANRDAAVDPGNLDVAVDNEQRELLAVLSRLYDENYSPRRERLTGARDALGLVIDTTPGRRTAAPSPAMPSRIAARHRAGGFEASQTPPPRDPGPRGQVS